MAAMTTSKRTGARTPSRDVQSALVDAAEAVLIREGPAGVTVRAVAIEAGVAPMGVYNRFGSKEGMVEALLIRGFDALREAVAAHGETDPIERLRNSGLRYRRFALKNQQHYSVMFGSVLAKGVPSPDLVKCATAAFQELVEHVSTGMAAGRLLPANANDVAQQIWSAVHGAVTLEMDGRSFARDPEANYRELLALLIRGLSVPSAEPGG
jgi:AcrR family transcriptional regulator